MLDFTEFVSPILDQRDCDGPFAFVGVPPRNVFTRTAKVLSTLQIVRWQRQLADWLSIPGSAD
jgi:hypothetical protein